MEKRRLSIEISLEDQVRMKNLVPWGVMGRVMRLLLGQVLDMVEVHGDVVLGAFLTGNLNVFDALRKGGPNGSIGSETKHIDTN